MLCGHHLARVFPGADALLAFVQVAWHWAVHVWSAVEIEPLLSTRAICSQGCGLGASPTEMQLLDLVYHVAFHSWADAVHMQQQH